MSRLQLTVFLLITVLSLSAQDSKIIKAEIKQADRLISEKKYSEALVHVNNALNYNELNLDALERKVNIYILSGDEKTAFKELDTKISESPQQPEYYYLRSILFLYKDKPQKAIEDLDNAEYYYMPEKFMYKVNLYKGVAYHYLGEISTAESNFKLAAKQNPRDASIWHSWGMMKYEERQYDEAIEYFNKSIFIRDTDPIAYYNLGMAYFKTDDLKNACYNFNRSCNLNHKDACKIYIMECTE